MKKVPESHIIGERGVNAFRTYCNYHNPYIMFRPTSENDFGIDGEVELTEKTEDGKNALGVKMLKVQIKSSKGKGGYIKRRKDGDFSFSAKKEDVDYWKKHELDVVLIIYDDSKDALYAKKIEKFDYEGSLNSLRRKKQKYSIEITQGNQLTNGDQEFVKRFSESFKNRVNYNSPEVLLSNMVRIKGKPRKLYYYKSRYGSKKEIYKHVTDSEAPYFTTYAHEIITPYPLDKTFDSFIEKILEEEKEIRIIEYNDLKQNEVYKRNYSEIIKLILKEFLSSKGIFFNREYNRFYFIKSKEEDTRSETVKSRKTEGDNDYNVVTHHTYGKDTFYRHVAFEIDFFYTNSDLFLILNPKYLFTLDGKETLEPKKITKYTNFIVNRQWNNAVVDQLYRLFSFLQNEKEGIGLVNHGNLNISLSHFLHQNVNHCILHDQPKPRKKESESNLPEQQDLFDI